MTARVRDGLDEAKPSLTKTGLRLESEGLQLLLAEMHALQAMIPAGARDLPSEADIEAGFDNMPV